MITINDQTNMDFLKSILANGPLPTWYIMQEAKQERQKRKLGTNNHDFTKTAIHRAKRKLGIVSSRQGGGLWVWRLRC